MNNLRKASKYLIMKYDLVSEFFLSEEKLDGIHGEDQFKWK